MTKYEHTQIGCTIIWVALGVAIFVAITGIFAQGGPATFLIIEVILLICAVVFCKLTIRIDDKILQWSFGIGIVRKQVLLAEIAACESIRIRWWYGWGIHLTPYGSGARGARPSTASGFSCYFASSRNQCNAIDVCASLTSWPPRKVPIRIRLKPVRLIIPTTAYCCSWVAILSSCPALK